jgi:hypothetical protein
MKPSNAAVIAPISIGGHRRSAMIVGGGCDIMFVWSS